MSIKRKGARKEKNFYVFSDMNIFAYFLCNKTIHQRKYYGRILRKCRKIRENKESIIP
jgi:hypothetical protein